MKQKFRIACIFMAAASSQAKQTSSSPQWWFVDAQKKENGPFSGSQMQELFKKGSIQQTTGIRCDQNTPFIRVNDWLDSGHNAFFDNKSTPSKDISIIKSNSNQNESKEDESKETEMKMNDNNGNVNVPSSLISAPFWETLKKNKSQNILVSGCGGGFDFYQGLPLYFALKDLGYNVYLANYTFHSYVQAEPNMEKWSFNKKKKDNKKKNDKADDGDDDDDDDSDDTNQSCIVVTNAKKVHGKLGIDKSKLKAIDDNDIKNGLNEYGRYYYPEYYCTKWFYEKYDQDVTIYTFPRSGCKQLGEGYKYLTEKFNIDTVILVDGGTDSLMTGREKGTGTVEEDFTSIFAVEKLDSNKIHTKILCCLGLGVDRYHGVSDVSTLRAIAELTEKNEYLGCIHLLPTMKASKLYRECLEFSCNFTNNKSIVGTSILTSIQGSFGNVHWPGQDRTKGSKLFINPLMGIYWFFNVNGVFNRIDEAFKTEQFFQSNSAGSVRAIVWNARQTIAKRNNRQGVAKEHENYPATDDLR